MEVLCKVLYKCRNGCNTTKACCENGYGHICSQHVVNLLFVKPGTNASTLQNRMKRGGGGGGVMYVLSVSAIIWVLQDSGKSMD